MERGEEARYLFECAGWCGRVQTAYGTLALPGLQASLPCAYKRIPADDRR